MENLGALSEGRHHDRLRHRRVAAQPGLEEMRKGAVLGPCRRARHTARVSTADVFHAATIGGCDRADASTISAGWRRARRPDIVLVDLKEPHMMPACATPLRSLGFHATDRGRCATCSSTARQVVQDGKGHDHGPGRCERTPDAPGPWRCMLANVPAARLPPPQRRRDHAAEPADGLKRNRSSLRGLLVADRSNPWKYPAATGRWMASLRSPMTGKGPRPGSVVESEPISGRRDGARIGGAHHQPHHERRPGRARPCSRRAVVSVTPPKRDHGNGEALGQRAQQRRRCRCGRAVAWLCSRSCRSG